MTEGRIPSKVRGFRSRWVRRLRFVMTGTYLLTLARTTSQGDRGREDSGTVAEIQIV